MGKYILIALLVVAVLGVCFDSCTNTKVCPVCRNRYSKDSKDYEYIVLYSRCTECPKRISDKITTTAQSLTALSSRSGHPGGRA